MSVNRLIMPSHVIYKDGLSCGDQIYIVYDFDGDTMSFQFEANACKYCSNACKLLQRRLNFKESEYIIEQCNSLIEEIDSKNTFFEAFDIPNGRKECVLGPVNILKECAKIQYKCDLRESRINLYVDKMDCDACATRENVSWLYQKDRHIHGMYNISNEKRKLLMKLGKVSQRNIDIVSVRKLYANLNEDDFHFMEEHKLLPMVYQNLKALNILDPEDSRWRLLIYQRQRTVVAIPEIKRITKFIIDNNKQASWIKGAFTEKFYKDKLMRNNTDFDLLVTDENDAFDIISYLLFNGFKIFPDSFSLKKIRKDGSDIYTGHLHFQKIINLQYRMIVDVNFTGFPMIRVASYVPPINKKGQIELESMLLITLCHLFKHKEVFIKDINDIYLMLIQDDLDICKLTNELLYNGLTDLFKCVLDFIIREYEVEENIDVFKNLKDQFCIGDIEYGDWPYDINIVNSIKKIEFEKFIGDEVESSRIYLYPIGIFCNLEAIDQLLKRIDDKFKFIKLTNNIYEIEYGDIFFLLTPIGLFLEMKEYYSSIIAKKIRRIATEILVLCGVAFNIVPYAIEFNEKWLDTERE